MTTGSFADIEAAKKALGSYKQHTEQKHKNHKRADTHSHHKGKGAIPVDFFHDNVIGGNTTIVLKGFDGKVFVGMQELLQGLNIPVLDKKYNPLDVCTQTFMIHTEDFNKHIAPLMGITKAG